MTFFACGFHVTAPGLLLATVQDDVLLAGSSGGAADSGAVAAGGGFERRALTETRSRGRVGMRRWLLVGIAGLLAVAAGGAPGLAGEAQWNISGDLSEACSCSVPCSCNFGESPSPHSFCWAMWALDIQKGGYGTIALDGLRLARANGAK